MKKTVIILSIIILCLASNAYAKTYVRKKYTPLSKEECLSLQDKLGLKYCPYDNDHLAGAAKACGHISNLPTGEDLWQLAQKLYNNGSINNVVIYGDRNEGLMRNMGIWENDSHIYYWTSEEAKDGLGGYIRMFALKGSIPYYAPRDGSGYVSHGLGKINFGETRNIITSPEHDSNILGYPNNDVLMTICYK